MLDRLRVGRDQTLRVSRWALKLVFPDVCAGCGVSGTWLCSQCAASARRIDLSTCCARCGYPVEFQTDGCEWCAGWVDQELEVRCVYEFSGSVREMIHLLKYRGQHARAEWCAGEMSRVLATLDWAYDVIVPVPLSTRRRRKRGFNQAEEIALRLVVDAQRAVPVVEAIQRNRDTTPQVHLPGDERARNVAGAFQPVEMLAGLRVLLVDDVVTTGSTLQECAAACRAAGAAGVYGIALARDVL